MIDKISNTIVNDKVKSVYGFNDYSIQDLLSKFFEQINSVTDLVNQNEEKINTQNFKLEEFINYMKNEGIPPIVIETVTTMYNDGRLTNLFNSLANNVIDKVEKFKTEINSQLEQKATKTQADNIQTQVNNLVLGAVGDGNNAEIIQARGSYEVVNDRLTEIEKVNKISSPTLTFSDGYIKSDDLTISQSSTYHYSEPFFVKGNTVLRVKVKGYLNNVAVVVKTDKNGVNLERLTNSSSDYLWYEFNILEDSYYRVSGSKTSKIIVTVKEEENNKLKEEFYKVVLNKGLCIGDSITKGYRKSGYTDKDKSYPAFLTKLSGWTCENGGESGFTSINWFNNWSDNYIKEGYDFYIIKLGQNGGLTDTIETDCVGDSYLDYAETNTGCYCKIIERIKERTPKAKIFLVSIKASSIQTNNVIKKIAQKYNLEYIDLSLYEKNLDDPIYHKSSTGESYDVHFNTLGYIFLTDAIYKGVLNGISKRKNEYIDF